MMVSFCLVLPLLVLFVRRRWTLRSLQCLLGFGSLIWTMTLIELSHERLNANQPFLRMACILGFVAIFTALSAWLLGRPALIERYRR